jgi:hypothetical protein
MKTCARVRLDGTCPELEKNNSFLEITGSICQFCKNDIAEICDTYKPVAVIERGVKEV